MYYFKDQKHIYCSHKPDMPFESLQVLPEEGEVLFLFRRPPLSGRETFAVSDSGVLTAFQDESLLSTRETPEIPVPPALAEAVALPAAYRLGSRWGRPVLLVLWGAAAAGIWSVTLQGRADALFGWLEERRWECAAALLALNALSVPLGVGFYARRRRGLYRT